MNWAAGASADPVVSALADYLGPVPRRVEADQPARQRRATIEEIAPEFGATRAAQNKAMADYFGVTVRTVQRWRTTGRERSVPKAARIARFAVDRARQIRDWLLGRFRRGLRMRITAAIRVSQVIRVHTMPQPMAPPAYIAAGQLRRVREHWQDGRYDQAGEQLLRQFFRSYWGNPEPLEEMGTIEAVDIT